MSRPRQFTDRELEAFLDEALAPEEMARLEMTARSQPKLVEALARVCSRRDAGIHTLGEIWRRHQVSCPDRQTLGSYLLGVLEPDRTEYYRFHLETVGCRYCQANLQDLQRRQAEADDTRAFRRTKYLQSSAGFLRREK